MRNKTILLTFVMCLIVGHGFSQSLNSASKKAYLSHLDTLFEEGRHCYADIGNKAQLMRVIITFEDTVKQGRDGGMLTPEDEDDILLKAKLDKLWGDFHYLNSDEDATSFAEAERCFKEALAYAVDEANARHLDIFYYQFVLHQELGQLYYKQGRYEEAYKEMKAAEEHSSYSQTLDFKAQLAMCKARIGLFEEAVNDINEVIGYCTDKYSESYGEALRKKAKMLMLQKESKNTGMVDPTDEALKCYKEYFTIKKADAFQRLGDMGNEDREQYWMRIRPFVVDCYRLENVDPAFLYDVTLFSKALLLEYARLGKPQLYTWKQVQKALKTNECAVEFVQYEKHGEKQMGALVLKKTDQPRFVGLGQVKAIKDYLLCDLSTVEEAMTEDCPDLKDELYSDTTFFPLIWTPDLLDAIGKNTQKLYFAADGLFHLLAIEYMLPNQASLKSLDLYRLSSTRQLLNNNTVKRGGNVLACGDINYYYALVSDSDAIEYDFANDDEAYRHIQAMNLKWNMLPGTKAEIDSICVNYGNQLITVLTDTVATETQFVRMAKQYPIVHVASHGYYGGITPEGTDLIPASYDESLSHNVLAFAGINESLLSEDFDTSHHDGILSAREISNMDLSHIDLIVLSACQTGLGFMTDDGVYGLQRGLKNAGVKGMIVSLWSVDDEATALLMQSFYSYLKSEDVHTAFMHAREDLIATGRESRRTFDPVKMKGINGPVDYSLPQFVNAFILIDIK